MNIKLEHGTATSPELSHNTKWYERDITCLKVNGLYNLKVGFFWVIENKKRLSTINKWLKNNGYETVFVDDMEA